MNKLKQLLVSAGVLVGLILSGDLSAKSKVKSWKSNLHKKETVRPVKSEAPVTTPAVVVPTKSVDATPQSWDKVFENIKDSVVQIFSFHRPYNFDLPFKQSDAGLARGSGFFAEIDGELCIITNFHVVDNADVIYLQHPGAWREMIALNFVGGSDQFDIARLDFQPGQREQLEKKLGKTLKPLRFGNSDIIKPGYNVMLVGYPLGQEQIKQAPGEISGSQATGVFGDCFTTTALSYPGNSGGACVNRCGEVVGVLVGGTKDTEGHGFVLPINRELTILNELRDGKVRQYTLWGFDMDTTTKQTFDYLGIPDQEGALINNVIKDSLCDQAGLREGDVILSITIPGFANSMPIDRFGYVTVPWSDYRSTLADILCRVREGATISFALWRDRQPLSISITKVTKEPFKVVRKFMPFDSEPAYEVFGGMVVMELTANHIANAGSALKNLVKQGAAEVADVAGFYSIEGRKTPRIIVTATFPETDLARSRLFGHPLNIIDEVNGFPVKTVDEYREAILKGKDSGVMRVKMLNKSFFVIKLQDALAMEPALSAKYKYPISELVQKLAA